MKGIVLFVCLLIAGRAFAQSYHKIHRKAIVVDTHNDILMKATDDLLLYNKDGWFAFDQDLSGKAHSDLARWKRGGLDLQVFSVFCEGTMKDPFRFANRQMDTLDAVAGRQSARFVKVATSAELYRAVNQHKMAAMFGVEGGHMIEDDLAKIDSLYKRGARYMTLTWNNSTAWATSALDETFSKSLPHKGLNGFGRQVVQRMNALGMMVDVSHAGEQTFRDVIETTSKPIIASHSSVYALCPHQRNLKDDQIRAIAKNGGVIQINFFPGFIDSSFSRKEAAFYSRHAREVDSLTKAGVSEWGVQDRLHHLYEEETNAIRPPLSMVIDHIDYIVRLVGADYVGLGSDFDGIPLTPMQLDDVSTYPLITKALLEKGYSKTDITKILGGNFLRVLKANEK